MKKRKFLIKVMVLVLIFVIGFQTCSPMITQAMTGEYTEVHSSKGDANEDSNLEDDMKKSKVLEYIAKFIFALARIVENLVTIFSKKFFGVNEYPWADLIVFNSMPYLDVNFINPAQGSIFSNNANANMNNSFTTLGSMIRSSYYSLLVLCAGLLGIGVAIISIRLAISSIAADKAKYKEALVKCIYTVVMLFSMHFLVSFLFYANETIVNMAAKLLTTNLNSDDIKALNAKLLTVSDDEYNNVYGYYKTNVDKLVVSAQEIFQGFIDTAEKTGNTVKGVIGGIIDGATTYDWEKEADEAFLGYFGAAFGYVGNIIKEGGEGAVEGFTEETVAEALEAQAKQLWKVASLPTSKKNGDVPKDVDMKCVSIFNYMHNQPDVADAVESIGSLGIFKTAEEDEGGGNGLWYIGKFFDLSYSSKGNLLNICYWSQIVYWTRWTDYDNLENVLKENGFTDTTIIKAAKEANLTYIKNEDPSSVPLIMTTLGDWFKNRVYGRNEKNKRTADLIAAIIYAIFIVQSLMLLFAYIKRIFYVILLSLLGPVIVIYDFLLGSI